MNSHLKMMRKVKYYTGLPNFATFMVLFNLLASSLQAGKRSVLSRFQQLMVVLVKFRLNLGDQDLEFRFSVNQSTISRCISKSIDVMYVHLNPLIKARKRRSVEDYAYGLQKEFSSMCYS